jgi:quercetin dioxygenase-like cupin family protein
LDEGSTSPFGTWNGTSRYEIFPGVRLHAVGGEQVLLCRVSYDPGRRVQRHVHEQTEQVMVVLEGEVELTVEGETQMLRAGDTAVVNRGLEHELYSESGATFFEALSPVPLDHVPDRARDLVLGPDGGSGHVEH